MHIHTFYIPSLDCDISTLNLHFYRSLNFIRYSNVSACDAAPRGGSTCNNKTPAMFCAKKAIWNSCPDQTRWRKRKGQAHLEWFVCDKE